MNNDKAELLEILQHNRECTPVGAIRAKTRCMLCGDSKRDLNKKRFYIICDPMTQDAVKYICFNCGEYGILLCCKISSNSALSLFMGLHPLSVYGIHADK